jgi:hypothetical protein
MAATSKNADTGLCRFTAEDLKVLAKRCEFGDFTQCLVAPPGSTLAACPPQYMPAYAQCFSEGNLRLPLSRFLCSVFEYYNLRFHQLGPLAVVRITCFEMQCRALGVTPAVGLFRHFFSLDSSRNTYSFLPRRASKSHVTGPCFSHCPSSSKLWRSNFFWLGEDEFPVHFVRPLIEPRERSEKDVPPDLQSLTHLTPPFWAVIRCTVGLTAPCFGVLSREHVVQTVKCSVGRLLGRCKSGPNRTSRRST